MSGHIKQLAEACSRGFYWAPVSVIVRFVSSACSMILCFFSKRCISDAVTCGFILEMNEWKWTEVNDFLIV